MTADDELVLRFEGPSVEDGVEMHRLAAESKVLDVNSRYAYLLWCRDFAETSVVAKARAEGSDDEEIVGFVTGYRRPDQPGALLVWQVAVSEKARGRGLAGKMLDEVFDRAAATAPTDHMETTITPDNEASIALFTAFAKRRDTEITASDLFDSELLGSDHEPEQRYRIGPIPVAVKEPA
jgi:L-2,4-diaminobutyric acid acetyltransferase